MPARIDVARHASALVAVLALGSAAGGALAAAGDWQLRARLLDASPGIDDGIGLFVTVEPLRFTELALAWQAAPRWVVELAVTLPHERSVKSAGFEVGRLRQLPPTLSAQYRPGPFFGGRLQPYVTAGISYTVVDNLRFNPDLQAALQPTLRNRSVGPVWGFGVELPLAARLSFHVDWKQLSLATDIEALGPGVGYFRVKPRYTGIGLGWRF